MVTPSIRLLSSTLSLSSIRYDALRDSLRTLGLLRDCILKDESNSAPFDLEESYVCTGPLNVDCLPTQNNYILTKNRGVCILVTPTGVFNVPTRNITSTFQNCSDLEEKITMTQKKVFEQFISTEHICTPPIGLINNPRIAKKPLIMQIPDHNLVKNSFSTTVFDSTVLEVRTQRKPLFSEEVPLDFGYSLEELQELWDQNKMELEDAYTGFRSNQFPLLGKNSGLIQDFCKKSITKEYWDCFLGIK